MKANFFCKAAPFELEPNATGGVEYEVAIEKILILTESEYAQFLKEPLADYDFVKENIELMWRDENNLRHCILIKTKDAEEGILIEAEGYGWARYATYISLKEDN